MRRQPPVPVGMSRVPTRPRVHTGLGGAIVHGIPPAAPAAFTFDDADAAAAVAAMSVEPSDGLKGLYDDLVVAWKAAGLWSLTLALWLSNVHDAQAANLNIRNPGTFNLTPLGAPAFTPFVGYDGDAVDGYLDTNFTPNADGGAVFVQDSASVFGWATKAAADNGAFIGMVSGDPFLRLYPRYSDNNAYWAINQSTGGAHSNSDGSGLHTVNRSGATAAQLYRNGASVDTSTAASVALLGAHLAFLREGATFHDGGFVLGGIMGSVNGTQEGDKYTILAAFKSGVEAL